LKKAIGSLVMVLMASLVVYQSSVAALEEIVTVAGTSFTIGTTSGGGEEPQNTNTTLKFLADLGDSSSGSNLVDTINGPDFDEITPEWTEDMPVKVHNKGQVTLSLIGSANYVSDPNTLRDDIFVEILEWNDANSNGLLDDGETGTSYGHDTILRLKNDTFALSTLSPGQTRGLVFRFDGSGVTETNFGMSAIYDFIISGTEAP
jgi:hypothetical protein